jgi:hypothetical protein
MRWRQRQFTTLRMVLSAATLGSFVLRVKIAALLSRAICQNRKNRDGTINNILSLYTMIEASKHLLIERLASDDVWGRM